MTSCPLIPADWDLPQVLRFRLGNRPGRQRAMQYEGHLLLVLHAVPKRRDRDRTGQLFWRDPEGRWRSTMAGQGEQAVDNLLGTYSAAIDQLTDDFDESDESIDYFEILGALGPIRRSIRNLHAALQNAREIQPEERLIINWRDRAYDLVRRAELLHNDAQTALDFETAHQAEAQAEASRQRAVAAHRLNILAAFFFPLATLSAILGVNLHHGWEEWESSHAPWVLMGVIVVGILIGLELVYAITRPTKRPKIERPPKNE